MRWLRRLFRKALVEKQVDAELRFHLDQQTDDYVARGMAPDEARRRARFEFGGLDQVKEECREVHWENHLETFFRDFQFALRSLRKDLRFALAAILALSLGIGSTTVIFSVIDNVLLRPFPYKDADRITTFRIQDMTESGEGGLDVLFISQFRAMREQNHVFEDTIGVDFNNVLYKDAEGTRIFPGARLTANTFQFLGVKPLLGRVFTPDDGNPGSPPVCMMSYRLWQEQFNADRKILGATLTLNGELRTLIGIMPPGFQLFSTRIWLPLSWSASALGSPEHSNQPFGLYAYGRRKPGVSLRAAAADLDVVAQQHSRIDPNHYPKKFTVATDTLADAIFGHYKAMLYTMFAAVTLLLLIACSNVANLLLVRATVRERELALRSVLGAGRGRLVRQLLVETFVLAAAGAVVGCLLTYVGLKGAVALIPPDAIPNDGGIALNPRVLLFTLAVTMLTTLVCGLVPAFRAVRGELPLRLKEGSQGASGGWRQGKVRSGLVIMQVALSVVLLVGAGLMMRAFLALEHVNLRFNPRYVLDAWLALPEGHYETAMQKRILFQQIFDRVRELPEVAAVAEASAMPLFGGPVSDVVVPGESNSESLRAMLQLCSPGYFKTLGLDLSRGRLLSEADMDSARTVVVINQTFARDSFGTQDPLGRRIKFKLLDAFPDSPHNASFEVIGIVADDKNQDLRKPPVAEAFLPYTLTGLGVRALLVRTKTAALPMLERVRKEVWAVDPDIAFHGVETIETALKDRAYAQPEVGVITLGIFAGMGLVLVAIGVFSVVAYSVSLRTQEFGIRMALGAQRSSVFRMVLLKGLNLIVVGGLIGALASLALARVVRSQLWGVSATDPLTFGAVIVVTLVVGFLACWLPARRATQVDPLVALRYE